VVGEVAGHKYLFLTVERTGGIMVYNVDVPSAPTFVQYVNTRDFSQTPGPGAGGDLHPENLVFVPGDKSPTDKPLLVVSYQVSGSVRIFEITDTAAATPLAATSAAVSDRDPAFVQPHRPNYHAIADVSSLSQPTRRIARRNDNLLAAATDKAIERLLYGFSSGHAQSGSLESSLDEVISGLVPAFRGARATV
jgi:hypothetical protein